MDKKVNLVLEGGGVKGIGLVGAIAKLEEEGYTWNYIGGTSAGAIVATLLAVGYTGKDLYKIMSDLDFTRIMDDDSVREDFFNVQKWIWPSLQKKRIIRAILMLFLKPFRSWRLYWRLKRNYGLFNGAYIESKVRELIHQKTHNGCYTFADLARDYDGDDSRLSLMVTDITNGRLLILPRDLQEKLNKSPEETELVEAMRMSMSFPLFFKPKEVSVPKQVEEGSPPEQEKAAASLRKEQTILLMDGGILSNFPYWYIEDLEEKRGKPHPTVGVLLDEGPRVGSTDLWSIVEALLNTMISPLDRIGHRAVNDRIVRVDTHAEREGIRQEISTLAFDLPKDQKDALYDNGRRAAQEWMDKYETHMKKKERTSSKMKQWSHKEGTTAAA